MEQSRRPGRGYHTQIRLGRWSFRENTTPASLATTTLRRRNRYHRQTAIAHYQRLRHGTAFPQPIGRGNRATHLAHSPIRYAATSRRTKQTYLKQRATKYRKSLTIRIKYNTPRLVITHSTLKLLLWEISKKSYKQ